MRISSYLCILEPTKVYMKSFGKEASDEDEDCPLDSSWMLNLPPRQLSQVQL